MSLIVATEGSYADIILQCVEVEELPPFGTSQLASRLRSCLDAFNGVPNTEEVRETLRGIILGEIKQMEREIRS